MRRLTRMSLIQVVISAMLSRWPQSSKAAVKKWMFCKVIRVKKKKKKVSHAY